KNTVRIFPDGAPKGVELRQHPSTGLSSFSPAVQRYKKSPPRKFQTKRIIKKSFCVIFITQKGFRVEWKADRDAGNQGNSCAFLVSERGVCSRVQ
ncbi:hypothetical protein, partial [uncultured Alistipes sp.]|uniref:hypothetical protein n=1 Tax=uncultured Alistipes sp. TaxID=538949 RepID=UPI00266EDAF1